MSEKEQPRSKTSCEQVSNDQSRSFLIPNNRYTMQLIKVKPPPSTHNTQQV